MARSVVLSGTDAMTDQSVTNPQNPPVGGTHPDAPHATGMAGKLN